jgi:superfamily I DNA/RNA helicase
VFVIHVAAILWNFQTEVLQVLPMNEDRDEYAYERKPDGIYVVVGPPGTGKTSYMSKQINRAAAKYGPSAILVTSFTRAAAVELAGRDLPVEPEQVATLHAHAYRSIGKPRLVETNKELIAQWNLEYPQYSIGMAHPDVDDPLSDEAPLDYGHGDELLSSYQLIRAKCQDVRLHPIVAGFARLWQDFKKNTNSIDFTDMIDIAHRDVMFAPGRPDAIFVDEAQDLTTLEAKLAYKWGNGATHLIVAGDDRQCIYSFKGADPHIFFSDAIPQERRKVLPQSYRVPVAVQAVAERWIKGLSKGSPQEYRARVDEQGNPVMGDAKWLGDSNFQDMRKAVNDAEQYVAEGKTVMFLASCAYMLNNLKAELRDRGLLFHNEYRLKRGDWNPLGKGRGVAALLAYFAPRMRGNQKLEDTREGWQALINTPLWDSIELDNWLSQMSVSKFLKRGAKKKVEAIFDTGEDIDFDRRITGAEWSDLLLDEREVMQSINGHIGWFLNRVQKVNYKKYEYLCQVIYKQRRPEVLQKPPMITIGTIHSVKGGQKDVVYLCPDLSRRGYDNWVASDTRDEVIRLFYVGMTRARDTLVILNPGSEYYVKGLHSYLW